MRFRFVFLISLLFCGSFVMGQDYSTELIDEDLDSLFDEPEDDSTGNDSEDVSDPEVLEEDTTSVLEDLVKQTGFTFQANYAFVAGYSPGWGETPWNSDKSVDKKDRTDSNYGYSQVIGVDMGSSFSLDFQLSPSFRVHQTFTFTYPEYDFDMSQFWGAYNLKDFLYFKIGQHEPKWGIGRNYSFTNLLSRIPNGASGGDAYTFQIDKPLGVGGLQLLAYTRSGFVDSGSMEDITSDDLGYGAKYNIAIPQADISIGSLYHKDMDLRSFLSISTTLWGRTEVYTEGLLSVDQKKLNNHIFSYNFGVYDDFFDERLSINYEYFWNDEKDISYVDDDDELIVVEKSPYIYGHNMALNIGYTPVIGSSFSLFFSGMYNVNEDTAKIMPGMRMKLMDDFSLYCAVPIALGDRDGTYYRSNYDENNRPFGITFALRLDGDYKFGYYK